MAAEKHQQQPKTANQTYSATENSQSLSNSALVCKSQVTILQDNTVEITLTAVKVIRAEKKRELKSKPTVWQSLASKFKHWVFNKMCLFISRSIHIFLLNRAFNGIVSILFVAILFTSILLLPQRSLATEIIEQKATLELLQLEQVNPSDNTVPLNQTEVENSPEEEIVDTSSDIDKIIKIETPSELVAPTLPESVKVETVITQPELTPEQSFIAAIEQQLADIGDRYSDELILSIEADLLPNLLLVKVSDDWYRLDRVRQNKWINDMFSRSQEFNFKKLEIKDINNTLIARSPVVGNEMVILQREKENG
ncbi:hypothetical protein IQ238_01980 [Pleurocapsales cyanobacterium LEGE 06147]|nr:hypothetical protein [Pleurocapsales cyanobacterium LEGE 06147]